MNNYYKPNFTIMKTTKLFSWLFALLMVALATSCKDDEPVVIIEDGLAAADGFYITQAGVDPTSAGALVAEEVSIGFPDKALREGLVGNYLYLASGSYNIVEVVSKAITQTIGGTAETITDTGSGCDLNDYTLITATVDGAAFSIANSGIHKVTYDATTNEITVLEIVNAGIIGEATDDGWGAGQVLSLSGTASETSTVFEGTGITLRGGIYKIRFNCRWNIDRRIDTNAPSSLTNGYELFTNFGGTADVLDPGGIDLTFDAANEGIYTVTVTIDANGVGLTLTRTGDAVALPTYPDVMYLVGAGTAYAWDTPSTAIGAEMHKIAGGTEGVYWKICHLAADIGFKISAADWGSPNLGFADVTEYDASGVAVTADIDGNMSVAVSGMYMIVLDLQNSSTKVSIVSPEVYGMGDTFGGWTEDVPANLFTVDDAAKTITSPALTADGASIRSYVNHAWITDWWNAEFVPNAGVIEYRNDGGDPSAIAGTAGQVITYSFDDNTSSVQ